MRRPQLAAAGSSQGRRATTTSLPSIQPRTGQPMGLRTSKISQKLVLLPETHDDEEADEEVESDAVLARRLQREDGTPLRDEELDVLKKRGGIRGKSYAERLPKVQRKDKVSRLTAYCTAQAYNITETSEFLRKRHEAKTKLYDDCLYTIYALPLLNGTEGYRVRGRPMLKTPGSGKTMLDLEIERSERRDHHGGYFEDDAYAEPDGAEGDVQSPFNEPAMSPGNEFRREYDDGIPSQINRLAPDAKNFAEMFVFSYGVVVFWNFTEHQEKDILADLTFANAEDGKDLLTRPLDQDDFETEEFHFEYSPDVKRPRVFNDMITLLPRSDHMIKLTISHAIAQSTKLCYFEERMTETMLDTQTVPRELAENGQLPLTREETVKILGRLFVSRVEINLCKCRGDTIIHPRPLMDSPTASNILDVPNFFWDSEPTLHPLYAAIRDYLEIDERIKVLNERCRVFLDLAEILSDSISDNKMSIITWIIIALIILSIAVTLGEAVMRFLLLKKGSRAAKGGGALASISWGHGSDPADVPEVMAVPASPVPDGMPESRETASDLELLASTLGLDLNAKFDDIRQGIRDLKQAAASAELCRFGKVVSEGVLGG